MKIDEELSEQTTPINVSEFEREQLRFFLASGDVVETLSRLNPSLAWLPILAELNLPQIEAALPMWVEQNFGSVQAIRDVVDNIRLFKSESARILESRLNAKRKDLAPVLSKCWRLIIRHIRNTEYRQNDWFELSRRLHHDDLSPAVLENLVRVLTPRLFVGKHYDWQGVVDNSIQRPTDILSIKYKVSDGVSESDFFEVWPKNVTAEIEEQVVRALTSSLSSVLADAVDVGVEHNSALSVSDIDVPSVARHEQNAFRQGFLPIVRITAELWSRLTEQDKQAGAAILHEWQQSPFRLIHRLALYAAADPRIAASEAADVLISLSQGELFLTNSQVEVHRLIRAKWSEFPEEKRAAIETRIVGGPPADWFREGADLSLAMDRYRFLLLLDLERSKIPLGKDAAALLSDIQKRHPTWRDAEPEKVGFAMWQGEVTPIVGGKEKLASVPSDQLIATAIEIAKKADFMEGDAWQDLCQADPFRAFLGIANASESELWLEWAWRPLFWSANKITDVDQLNRVAELFSKWPKNAPFSEVALGASFWIDQVSEKLKASTLWAVWDLIERRSPRPSEMPSDDLFTAAVNSPSGNLAYVLLKRTPQPRGQTELGKRMQGRYKKLIGGNDVFSLLARVRLSAEVAFLFQRAPKWTSENLLPDYDWQSPDARAMWSARKYSSSIGSKELFGSIKRPFLEIFSRSDVTDEDRRVFADWMAAVLIANEAGNADYPLASSEVRSILRKAGSSSLSAFARRLAMEMGRAGPDDKTKVWKETVGPIFQNSWPLDVESQTWRATHSLVQLVLNSGGAIADAAAAVTPFVRSDGRKDDTGIYSISQANEDLYKIAPDKMLDLLSAVAGDAPDRSLYGMRTALDKLSAVAPRLVQTKSFQRLASQAMPY